MLILIVCHHYGVSICFVLCLNLLKLIIMGKMHPSHSCVGCSLFIHLRDPGPPSVLPNSSELPECMITSQVPATWKQWGQNCNGVKTVMGSNLAKPASFTVSERRRHFITTCVGEANCLLPSGALVWLHVFSLQRIHGLLHVEELTETVLVFLKSKSCQQL